MATSQSLQIMSIKEVEHVEVTVLMDNITDLLMAGSPQAKRAMPFKGSEILPPLRAEHGFSALVNVQHVGEVHSVMLDTGISRDGVLYNADILAADLSKIEAIVISHGHYDHTAGLASILKHIGKPGIPVIIHPDAFLKRWLVFPNNIKIRMPPIEEKTISEAGGKVVKTEKPSSLAGNMVLVTGEIPRRTAFERGFPPSYAEIQGKLQPDPLIKDDQALVVNVKGKGLVVISGCGHAGIINTINYAKEITGVDKVHAVLGGFHLTGRLFEPFIDPTIEELRKIKPDFIVPSHCTGFKAINEISNMMPESFIGNTVGTTFVF